MTIDDDRPAADTLRFETLQQAGEIGAEEGLNYIYIGHVPGAGNEDTVCPGCGQLLIRRNGFSVTANHVRAGRCPQCGTPNAGVGMGD